MSRWLKVTLAVLAGVVVLLLLNAVAVSNETKDAEVTTDGAELADTSGGTLQVLEEGDPKGTAVVLIHGYAGSMRWYDKLAELLGTDHRVIRVDLLGHGGSEKPSAGYAIPHQASATAEALASLGVANATVVGHSLGAAVAIALAEQSPELAAKMVNLDEAPSDDYENDAEFTEDVAHVPVIGQALSRALDVAPTSIVRDQYEIAFAPGFNIASGFENPDQVVDDLSEMTYTAFTEAEDSDGDYTAERPLDERLGSLEVPALVIFGSEDQTADAEAAIEPYEGVASARTELIDGIGHSPNVEAPEEIAPLISAFAMKPLPDADGGDEAAGTKDAKKGGGKKDDGKAEDGGNGDDGRKKPARDGDSKRDGAN